MPKEIIFNKQNIEEIIKLYKSSVSCKKIGKQFNCSKQTINKLLKLHNVSLRDTSHSNRKYYVNENIFEKIDSHEKAYWLGMLTGDGWITKRNEFGLSLQNKDKAHMDKYKKFLKSTHPIRIINNRIKNDGSPSISHALIINNKKIVSDLEKYKLIPNKTLHMSFPNLHNEFLASYMLGLVDSDGCFCLKSNYKNKNIKQLNFSFVGPTEFVEKFQQILIDTCQISKTKLDIQKNTNFIRIVHYGGYKNIFKIVKFIYENSTIFLHRKKEIAINFLIQKYPNDDWLNKQLNILSI